MAIAWRLWDVTVTAAERGGNPVSASGVFEMWLTMEGITMATKTVLAIAAALGCSLLAGRAAWADVGAADQSAQDARITRAVQQRLNDDFPNWAGQIQVVTQNGVVTLSGYAKTFVVEEKAVEDAHAVHGVMDVHNQLRLVG
jgi:osmotically-inducible protein OsmY